MSCHVTSCHVMSCHVMSFHVMSCHVTSCHVMSCHVMSCHVMSCHVTSCHVTSCHVMSCHVMSCYVMSCDALNHDVVWYVIMSCNVVTRNVFSALLLNFPSYFIIIRQTLQKYGSKILNRTLCSSLLFPVLQFVLHWYFFSPFSFLFLSFASPLSVNVARDIKWTISYNNRSYRVTSDHIH